LPCLVDWPFDGNSYYNKLLIKEGGTEAIEWGLYDLKSL